MCSTRRWRPPPSCPPSSCPPRSQEAPGGGPAEGRGFSKQQHHHLAACLLLSPPPEPGDEQGAAAAGDADGVEYEEGVCCDGSGCVS